MKIQGIKQNKTETPNFGGIKIARVKPLKAQVEEDVFIYSLDKEKDKFFCNNLADKLIKSTKERMNTEKSTIFQFLYNAFASIEYADNAILAVKGKKPFGFMSILNTNADKNTRLAYLATWKTPEFEKIKNGGSMLITHLLHTNENKNKITLTPAFNSDLFYYKFGFDYEDEYTMTTMYIDKKDMQPQLKRLAGKFDYNAIKDSPPQDLSDVMECK